MVVPGADPAQRQESTVASLAVAEEAVDYGDEGHADLPDAPDVPKPQVAEVTPQPNGAPLMTVEAVLDRIGEAVLKNFKEQFNGKPSEMRHIDEKDRIFESENQS